MTDPHADLRPSTLVVSLGRPVREVGSPLNPPIELSSTYLGSAATSAGSPVYGRTDNATWHAFESALGTLESAPEGCAAFSSGMAAIAATLSLLDSSQRDDGCAPLLVLPPTAYNTTVELAQHLAALGRLEVRVADFTDPTEVVSALHDAQARARVMVWIESPSNPMLDVVDIPAVIDAARAAGALVVADNTFATPLRQQPLAQGADVVVHSATKYLAGHSDLLMGAVVTQDPDVRQRLVTQRRLTGAVPGPFEAWLALRGLRTLDVRLDRAEANARHLATRLRDHPAVTRVRYPGTGAMVSIEVGPSAATADAVVGALQLWTPATSLGGVESLAERRRRHANEPDLVPESLIRLSVGIEAVEDLWHHLEQALAFAVGEKA